MQKIVFESARDIYDRLSPSWQGSKEQLLAQLIGLVEAFISSGKIDIDPPLFYQDELKRRLMLTLNMNKIVQHVFSKIVQDSSEGLTPIFHQNKPIRSTSDMLPWYSGRPRTAPANCFNPGPVARGAGGVASNSCSFEFACSRSRRFSFGNSAMISCVLISQKCRVSRRRSNF